MVLSDPPFMVKVDVLVAELVVEIISMAAAVEPVELSAVLVKLREPLSRMAATVPVAAILPPVMVSEPLSPVATP